MEGFQEGYEFFSKNAGTAQATFKGKTYVGNVEKEIDNLVQAMRSMKGYDTKVDQLKGDAAEFWHGGTFNINAAVRGSKNRVSVERDETLASADIIGPSGEKYGLKYYKNGATSAKQQAKSIFQRYKEYGGPKSLEEYLAENGYSEDVVLSDPIYSGQVRVIPADQMKEAIAYLERKIAKEAVNRPEEAERYRETLKLLKDRISDNKGNESIPLTEEDARKLAELAKKGEFDPAAWGLTTEELIKYKYVLQQAFQAGLSAATISIVLKVAPEIIKAIQYLIINGELDEKQFQKIGFAALSGGAEGFVLGSVAAAITTACKAGLWGEALKTAVKPSVIGVITVITMDTMKNSFAVATGKMTRRELADELVRETFIAVCSILGGTVLAKLPVVGFMLGSFMGSVLGSFVYSTGYSAVISFCVDTGFTMFGLVDQDYTLPEDVMRQIGLPVFDYDKFEYPAFSFSKFTAPNFEYPKFEPDSIDILFLRRGVIEVRRIGYI